MSIIYTLIDPRTSLIRYVGKTENTTDRLSSHIREAKKGTQSYVYNWIRELLRLDLVPLIKTIEECNNWQEREIFWIQKLREDGYPLTNASHGGDGARMSQEQREKLRIKAINRFKDPKEREKIAKTLKGRKATEEVKLKIKEAHKKRKNNLEEWQKWKDSISRAQKGRKWSKTHKRNQAKAATKTLKELQSRPPRFYRICNRCNKEVTNLTAGVHKNNCEVRKE